MNDVIRVSVGTGFLSPAVSRHLQAPVNAVPKVLLGAGSLPAVQRHVEKAQGSFSSSTKAPVQAGDSFIAPAVLRHLGKTPVQVGDAFVSPAVARHLSRGA